MTSALRLVADGSIRSMIEAALSTRVPLGALTYRAYLQLVDECGDYERAVTWLAEQAERFQKPILLNLEHADGNSTTITIPPKDWSEERLLGWIGGYADVLEAEFGAIGSINGVGRAAVTRTRRTEPVRLQGLDPEDEFLSQDPPTPEDELLDQDPSDEELEDPADDPESGGSDLMGDGR